MKSNEKFTHRAELAIDKARIAAGDGLWWFIPLVWALIPLFNTVAFLRVPLAEMTVHEEGSGIGKMLCRPEFLVAFLLMICAGASEQAMAQWASMFCEKGLGVTKVVGDILGPCMFAVMMGVGRTLHGLLGGKLNMQRLLFGLSAFTVGCYIVTVFVPASFVSAIYFRRRMGKEEMACAGTSGCSAAGFR